MQNPNFNVQNSPQNLGMDLIMNENYIKNNDNSMRQPRFDEAPTESGSSVSGSSGSSSGTASSISRRSHRHKHRQNHRSNSEISPNDSVSSAGTRSISSSNSSSGSSDSYDERRKYDKMSREKLLRKKRELLYKFERLDKRNGYSHNYTMESDYVEMKREYDRIINDKQIDASVKFQRKALIAFVSGVEFMNGKFDPVGAKLEGWSESISEDIDSYDEIFEELYEKYKGKSNMPPEMRLIFSLVSSGVLYHVTNSIFAGYKQQMPDIDKVLNNNPELKKQFAAATAKEMGSEQKQGGNDMMGGIFNMMGSMMGGGKGGNNGGLDIGGLMQNLGGMMQPPSQRPQQPTQHQYNVPQRKNIPPQQQQQQQRNFNGIMKDIDQRINMETASMSELTDGSGSISIMSDNISLASENDGVPKHMIGKKMMSM